MDMILDTEIGVIITQPREVRPLVGSLAKVVQAGVGGLVLGGK